MQKQVSAVCGRWRSLASYQTFEQLIVLALSGLISIVVALAV